MSKKCKITYDATMDAVKYTLIQMKNFYLEHPMPQKDDEEEDSVTFYFDIFIENVVKGWKDLEYVRHPFDFNRKMAEHSDISPATLRRIYNKK
jgi:hypothetical protein